MSFKCNGCGRVYFNENAVRHHQLTHLPGTVRCLCCPRKFTTYFGMIIHLEAGTCKSNIRLVDLNRLAAQLYQWKQYLDKTFRQELLAGDLQYREDDMNLPFNCPRCAAEFPLLSSLFQHVWSKTCGQGMNGGAVKKLKRWLAKRLYRYRVE